MTLMYETSNRLAAVPHTHHGFFGRQGGSSLGEFAESNMSVSVGDAPDLVELNRRAAAESLGFGRERLALLKQVHSNRVHRMDGLPDETLVEADALVTSEHGVALGILTADCAPILMADPEAGVIGAAHAGWRGAADGIIANTVAAMVALGAHPEAIIAAVGPSIGVDSYEVGPQFMDDFVQRHPDSWRHFTSIRGRAHFDLPGFVDRCLVEAGISAIERVGGCTYADPDRYFSHRYATHHGTRTGRQIAIIARH